MILWRGASNLPQRRLQRISSQELNVELFLRPFARIDPTRVFMDFLSFATRLPFAYLLIALLLRGSLKRGRLLDFDESRPKNARGAPRVRARL